MIPAMKLFCAGCYRYGGGLQHRASRTTMCKAADAHYLVPAKEYWAGTVPAVMPTQGRYRASTTMFTGLALEISLRLSSEHRMAENPTGCIASAPRPNT